MIMNIFDNTGFSGVHVTLDNGKETELHNGTLQYVRAMMFKEIDFRYEMFNIFTESPYPDEKAATLELLKVETILDLMLELSIVNEDDYEDNYDILITHRKQLTSRCVNATER